MGINSFRNPLTALLYFFNICYYMGAVTYRFKFCPETNKYVIVQNNWQKTICIIFAVFYSLDLILYFRTFVPYSESLVVENYSPLTYFKMAVYMSNVGLFIILITTQWARSKEFLKVINVLHETPSCSSSCNANPYQVLSLILMTFCAIGIYMTGFIAEFVTKESPTAYATIDGMREETLSLLFLESLKEETNTLFYTILLGFIRLITLFSIVVFNIFGELLSLNCAFCLKHCLNGFRATLKRKSASYLEAYEEFNNLQRTTHLFNEACGLLVFGVTLGLLPYFVFSVVEITSRETEFPVFIMHLVDSVLVYGFILYAANLNRKALQLSDRFIHQYDLSCLSHYELERLLREVSENRIGLSGAGYFTVTCPFLGSLIGLIFTFSVVLLQFKNSATSSPVVPAQYSDGSY